MRTNRSRARSSCVQWDVVVTEVYSASANGLIGVSIQKFRGLL